ncbi:hypothetical protein HAX54_013216 [Datura stramonium]|uniref:Uncharacterized protein n=1 Tax=Datura stramonium TaxID=4076 RepID=A0ABS8RY17_DATST|nr:hypothetical protein [Datura stramonium]
MLVHRPAYESRVVPFSTYISCPCASWSFLFVPSYRGIKVCTQNINVNVQQKMSTFSQNKGLKESPPVATAHYVILRHRAALGPLAHTVALGGRRHAPDIAPSILSRRALHRTEEREPRAWHCANHLPRHAYGSVFRQAPRTFGRASVAVHRIVARAGMVVHSFLALFLLRLVHLLHMCSKSFQYTQIYHY